MDQAFVHDFRFLTAHSAGYGLRTTKPGAEIFLTAHSAGYGLLLLLWDICVFLTAHSAGY